ncbi:MAG: hypothetical protein L0Z52_09110, partial [Acidobacteria bacterium]|nr:hypothetical protein [Acidobacteriota bacterium]
MALGASGVAKPRPARSAKVGRGEPCGFRRDSPVSRADEGEISMARRFDVITFDCYGTLVDWDAG